VEQPPPPRLRLSWSTRALRDSDRLDPKTRTRIVAALDRYAETRYGDVAKLADIDPPEYRLRVGPWRVRFAWDQPAGIVTVLHIFGRGQGYD
jgi:mRNA-degrading endonuclease RelE of RelBE toxin-antitoxin system